MIIVFKGIAVRKI